MRRHQHALEAYRDRIERDVDCDSGSRDDDGDAHGTEPDAPHLEVLRTQWELDPVPAQVIAEARRDAAGLPDDREPNGCRGRAISHDAGDDGRTRRLGRLSARADWRKLRGETREYSGELSVDVALHA